VVEGKTADLVEDCETSEITMIIQAQGKHQILNLP
jgi:hypothetical protein